MRKSLPVVALALGLAGAFVAPPLASAQDGRMRIERSLRALEDAQRDIAEMPGDMGGRKGRILETIEHAKRQIHEAIAEHRFEERLREDRRY